MGNPFNKQDCVVRCAPFHHIKCLVYTCILNVLMGSQEPEGDQGQMMIMKEPNFIREMGREAFRDAYKKAKCTGSTTSPTAVIFPFIEADQYKNYYRDYLCPHGKLPPENTSLTLTFINIKCLNVHVRT